MVRGCYIYDKKYSNFEVKNGTKLINFIKFIKPTEPILQINYNKVDKFYPLIRKKFSKDIDNINIIPFETSHDCSQGYGYTFFINEKKIKVSFCSDLGMVSNEVLNSILGSNLIFMESNHDIEMLKNGPYPWYLKERILSDIGHLSNNACSEVLNKLILSGTKKFVLCHLSSTNNTPEVAYNSAFKVLENTGIKDFELYVAPKENVGKININI